MVNKMGCGKRKYIYIYIYTNFFNIYQLKKKIVFRVFLIIFFLIYLLF